VLGGIRVGSLIDESRFNKRKRLDTTIRKAIGISRPRHQTMERWSSRPSTEHGQRRQTPRLELSFCHVPTEHG
jgi:hypothetical protein